MTSIPVRLCLFSLLLLQGCNGISNKTGPARPGGRLITAQSAGPKTFNRLSAFDDQTATVTGCLTGALLRINRQTQQPEPELAESWQVSPDGRALTFKLRRNVTFSDGHPFTADDVLFTFAVVNDPNIQSALSDQFVVDGQRVQVEKQDDATVRVVFPVPYAAAERLFDGLPILPRHVLEPVWQAGKFAEAWSLATPPEQIVGLGPFKLKSWQPGERAILARNEHYWKNDAAGTRLPYVDELVFEIIPDRNTQLLKFQNGELDFLSPVNANELSSLAPLAEQHKISLADQGPGMIREVLWFNLNEGKDAKNGQPFVDPVRLSWFRMPEFRQAISAAIDRDAIVRLVYGGRAEAQFAFLSRGDKLWFHSGIKTSAADPARAKQLLQQAGFRWQSEGGALLDAQGRTVEFTLVTNANAQRQKMSTMIQDDLAKLGIKMNVATLDSRALLSKINENFAYEAGLLAISSGDTDPHSHTSFLLSSGANHWWHPQQKQPATAWEARIDELMQRQKQTIEPQERKKLFDEVQQIMADQQPLIFLATRHLIVAARADVGNFKPAVLPDFALWNCEELYRRP